MDQIKTGKFIQQARKEKGYTQAELADKLFISDKTVSKWECGNGMPDVSLMLPLCKLLGISVNELFSGERLSDADYKTKAEENIMELALEKKENKRKIALAVIAVLSTLASAITLYLAAGLLEMPVWVRIVLCAVATVSMAGGIVVAVVLDASAGTYECANCKQRFVPTVGAYTAGMHTILRRRLKCPHCGKVTWCKKRLTRGDK